MFKKDTRDLIEEIIDSIPDIHKKPEYVAAAEKYNKFKADFAAAEIELRNVYNAYVPPGAAMSREDDASKLFAGEQLLGTSRDTQRQILQRKTVGLKGAADISLQEVVRVELRLSLEACAELEPKMMALETETLEIFDKLEERLEKMDVLYQAFSQAGIGEDRRIGYWRLTNFESQLLHGGSFPTLKWFINQRRESWGLPIV